ncbi:hypothetical protein P170DRAFT_125238 [Aspergillus steynii IBT 23096]|uniref:Uncharacterized protein n=1 Tax=Aspergillus steynii IBT 23096 TaxID=1392250 RepID=A0A2I2GJY9_9EURO|nr:uncharacterized protein P170DRAFT_125238 [Aspergillus steynii IBT 23096]PLB53193.1 hypothetical protein P170DRAFT_125238 [Aspergillus steynii IBT 23096]
MEYRGRSEFLVRYLPILGPDSAVRKTEVQDMRVGSVHDWFPPLMTAARQRGRRITKDDEARRTPGRRRAASNMQGEQRRAVIGIGLRIRIIRSSSLSEGAVSSPEGFRMTVLLGGFDRWIARRGDETNAPLDFLLKTFAVASDGDQGYRVGWCFCWRSYIPGCTPEEAVRGWRMSYQLEDLTCEQRQRVSRDHGYGSFKSFRLSM